MEETRTESSYCYAVVDAPHKELLAKLNVWELPARKLGLAVYRENCLNRVDGAEGLLFVNSSWDDAESAWGSRRTNGQQVLLVFRSIQSEWTADKCNWSLGPFDENGTALISPEPETDPAGYLEVRAGMVSGPVRSRLDVWTFSGMLRGPAALEALALDTWLKESQHREAALLFAVDAVLQAFYSSPKRGNLLKEFIAKLVAIFTDYPLLDLAGIKPSLTDEEAERWLDCIENFSCFGAMPVRQDYQPLWIQAVSVLGRNALGLHVTVEH